jgi:hypothetical protein
LKIRLHLSDGETRDVVSRWGRLVVAVVPVVLVNAVAFAGQLAFLRAHLPWPLAGQLLMAGALESIAVYVAFHAHVAALANDSALRLRLASYGFAAVIGAINYSHYAAPGWRPTFAAVAVGLMSAASPWLCAVHSRRASRDQLLAAGLVEPHALRLGATRWMWHPLRSARVMYHATSDGVSDPRAAITAWEARCGDALDAALGRTEAGRQEAPDLSADRNDELSAGTSQTGLRTGSGTGSAELAEPVRKALPGPVPDGRSEPVSDSRSGPVRPGAADRSGKRAANRSGQPVTGQDAEQEFAAEIAAGQVPSLYQIRNRLHVGNDRAKALRQQLARQALSA